MPRYRFADFTVSPRQRCLLHQGREVPLIPRYLDLLILLIDRRHEAVHRRDIFDRVWADVVVSDSALSQAIRTIRRTLGDDSREPRFIRTVSRHGYRFVYPHVAEEDDAGGAVMPDAEPIAIDGTDESASAAVDPFEPLLARIAGPPDALPPEEEQREAAELLHTLGTREALARLGTRPGHAHARAVLRDTRWEVPGAGEVPIIGGPQPVAAAGALLALRVRRAARTVAGRWAGAAAGGGLAGAAGGALGGLLLASIPGSDSPVSVAPVLALIGGACGALGGAGVGAGLAIAEATARSRRGLALIAGGACGGALVGVIVQMLARWSLSALVGLSLPIGGGWDGLAIGAAAGLGYALATAGVEGLAAPRGRRRLRAAATVAACCGAASLGLTLSGQTLVGGTINMIAMAAHSSAAALAPLGQLIGEPDFGPLSRAVLGCGEGALFGFGLAFGLTRRPAGERPPDA